MKVVNLILVTILSSFLLLNNISAGQNVQTVFCVLLIALVVFAKNDLNSRYMVVSYLMVFTLGKIVFYPIEMYVYPNFNSLVQNSAAFGMSFLLDILLIYLVRNRMLFSLMLTGGEEPSVLEKNYTEGPLFGLLLGYASIDLVAFVENVVRNLEYFGFSKEFAKQFWHVTFFYDYYEYLKGTLMALSITVLYMGVVIRKRQMPSAA
ncbi:hypothetical protein NI389_08270 [Pseudoalteromonas xiamenensis]|uniref:hypothetical protein n=1 Tax=Pseudoalteromonas xiamenensis TaxID=882626 RepID=UPI0027E556E8|nr:hypothetical protein [Pseudoalteromonas xiamenensis]WMN61361.1 hypothetical protein NI389_08270 [Pseudoalteromonas xiamenensis]